MLSSEKLRIKQKITYNGKYLSMYTKYILNKNWDAITFMAKTLFPHQVAPLLTPAFTVLPHVII